MPLLIVLNCPQEKNDQRDSRRLIYDGRVAVPQSVQESAYVWRDCQLLQGRTETATMLPTRAMETVEAIAPDALPPSTDGDFAVKGASKCAQVGEDGMAKLIQAALKGAALTPRNALIIWEVNPGWGHTIDAFISLERSWKFPACYLTTSGDSGRLNWIQQTRLAKVRKMHAQGELQVPGYTLLPQDPPKDLLESPPPEPQLHHAVIVDLPGPGGDKSLAISQTLLDTWKNHALCGAEWQEYLDRFYETWGQHGVQLPSAKRGSDALPQEVSLAKKPKLDGPMVNVEDLPAEGAVCTIKMTQKGQTGCSLRIGVGNKLHVLNVGKEPVELTSGMLVCGFGKAKFKPGDDCALPDTARLYQLHNSTDEVLMGKRRIDLGTIIEERRATDPECKVAYHNMEPMPHGAPGAFTLTVVNNIYFIPDACNKELINPQEPQKVPTQQMAAGEILAVSAWAQGTATQVIWMVQWGINGLMPVRPVVVLKGDVTIPPGSAFQLL